METAGVVDATESILTPKVARGRADHPRALPDKKLSRKDIIKAVQNEEVKNKLLEDF
jgi:hypothetical protein